MTTPVAIRAGGLKALVFVLGIVGLVIAGLILSEPSADVKVAVLKSDLRAFTLVGSGSVETKEVTPSDAAGAIRDVKALKGQLLVEGATKGKPIAKSSVIPVPSCALRDEVITDPTKSVRLHMDLVSIPLRAALPSQAKAGAAVDVVDAEAVDTSRTPDRGLLVQVDRPKSSERLQGDPVSSAVVLVRSSAADQVAASATLRSAGIIVIGSCSS